MKTFLDGRVVLYAGDCLDVLPTIAENSIDACVTDPPYSLNFMGKKWDDDIATCVDVWQEMFCILKPGAHLLAFGGTRTYHRMVCAIEDAGFEIRDTIMWVYGSGFPKSRNVSKDIDKMAGAKRKVVAPATDAARQWNGWGTALKPAVEPIVLARKPISEKTVAANVLHWGTGAINVDGCRIEAEQKRSWRQPKGKGVALSGSVDGSLRNKIEDRSHLGRWPANVLHDGSDEVVVAFPITASGGNSGSAARFFYNSRETDQQWLGRNLPKNLVSGVQDFASRLHYCAKANKRDRAGSKHPTIKPVRLKQYLCRLITPPGGTILDPFAGTGTTAEAAYREGFNVVLIERESEYRIDIRRRMSLLI